ncbi:MAG: UbiD family decarboxylase [Chloroflexi bacterium]|jgi:4-hydroxy-3-polyprenylbenzoate decarboxylase|nr:UbiD family decarboxylase [Chloroflexota bacterium]
MTSRNLGEFIGRLEHEGQLLRISAPVSRDLEITEIVDRVSKGPPEKNKALLLEKVNGCSMPVAINLFGSAQRMAWALGVDRLDELEQRLGKVLDLRLPQGMGALLERGAEMLGVLRAIAPRPQVVGHAACR